MQAAPLDLLAQAGLVCAFGAYVAGVRRLAAAGRRWPARRSVAFGAGLFTVWVAIGSPLASYDDTVVTLHVVQHLLLMMVAPPLVVMGQPVVLAAQAARRRNQARVVWLIRGPFAMLTNPVGTWLVYLGSMLVMLANRPVFAYLAGHDLAHDASHAWLLAVGVAYWEPLLGPQGTISRPARVMSVLANMPFEVMVGIWLRYQTRPFPGGGNLHGTQQGGEAFIVGAAVLSVLWLTVIVGQWAASAWREERRARRRPAATGWWTPWWVSAEVQQIPDPVHPPR